VAAAGVRTVQSFQEGRQGPEPWAVVIEHTRTTYVAVHTEDAQADEVGRRISTNAKFDVAVSRSLPLDGDALDPSWPRFSIWKDGARAAYVAFDAASDTYYIGAGMDQAGLDVALPFGSDFFGAFSGAALFDATAGHAYPDLFFRARTALEPVSVQYPAQVVASLKTDYVCVGYQSSFFSAAGTSGSHGTRARLERGHPRHAGARAAAVHALRQSPVDVPAPESARRRPPRPARAGRREHRASRSKLTRRVAARRWWRRRPALPAVVEELALGGDVEVRSLSTKSARPRYIVDAAPVRQAAARCGGRSSALPPPSPPVR